MDFINAVSGDVKTQVLKKWKRNLDLGLSSTPSASSSSSVVENDGDEVIAGGTFPVFSDSTGPPDLVG